MTRSIRVTVFGGQGVSALFSKKASMAMMQNAESSSIGSLLLSRCHAAFLNEMAHAKLMVGAPAAVEDLASLQKPENLLNPGDSHRNPIIQGITLILHQLLEHLARICPADATLDSILAHHTDEAVGFCSGVLSAIVICCAETIDEYLEYSVQALRLAFWIGFRQAEYCQHEEGKEWLEKGPWAAVLLKRDVDVEWVNKQVAKFNSRHCLEKGENPRQDVVVSSTNSSTSVSLVGSPERLREFQSQLGEKIVFETVPIYGLYHAGQRALPLLRKVQGDIERRKISLPTSSSALKRTLRSSATGLVVRPQHKQPSSASEQLLDLALSNILIESVQWQSTWTDITKQSHELNCHIEVKARGPIARSLLSVPISESAAADRVKVSYTNVYYGDQREQPSTPQSHNDDDDDDSVAIVGLSVNFPNGDGKEEFWASLADGLSSIDEIGKNRPDISEYLNQYSSSHPKFGNFIKKPWDFDQQFFNMSPREVKSMDPQQRLLLQTAVHAFEDAGYTPDSTLSYQRSSMGCYVGVATNDYIDNLRNDIDVYYSTGTLHAFLSGKISYAFKFEGPSIVVNTACSSSLIAIYQACRALRNGDCSSAIAGGVNTITSGDMYQGLHRAHFLSPSGQCKAFDSSADGYCRSEGCGLVVLKKLKDAIAENDRIYGVIKGVEVNQCGNAHSITHPHQEAQQALFRKVLGSANVSAESVNVVEAHGTGTQAGDAAEIASISAVFGQPQGTRAPLYISSVKSNIGHLEAASGVAGLSKLLLMLREKKIPQQAKLQELNPRLLTMSQHSLAIARETETWHSAGSGPRRALLNNFGAAGSNAALLLEEYIQAPILEPTPRMAYPFVLSAKSTTAVEQLRSHYVDLLTTSKGLAIQDVCYTSTARRERHDYQVAVTCQSVEDLVDRLKAQAAVKTVINPQVRQPVIFSFSGQGASFVGMGKELLQTAPVFAEAVHSCNLILTSLGFPSVLPMLDGSFDAKSTPLVDQITISQCSCFILQHGLSQLWRSWNIVPDMVLGHSLGEYAAMVDAGVLSVHDALYVLANRAALMANSCRLNETTMLAVSRSSDSVQEQIDGGTQFSGLNIACYNSLSDCVVSGPIDQIDALSQLFKSLGWQSKKLDVPFGFHSSAMECIANSMEQLYSTIQIAQPKIPVGSNYFGRLIRTEVLTPQYFINQTRYSVRFVDMIHAVLDTTSASPEPTGESPTFIDIGPAGTTLSMVKKTLSDKGATYCASMSPKQDPWATLTSSLFSLGSKHPDINWRNVFDGTNAQIIDTPRYPFASTDLIVPFTGKGLGSASQQVTEVESPKLPFGLRQSSEPGVFETSLSDLSGYIKGHVVGGAGICPASVYHGVVLEAAASISSSDSSETLVVTDLCFEHPLVYDESRDSDIIAVTLDTPVKDSRLFSVTSSTPGGSGKVTVHCRGTIGFEKLTDLGNRFSRNSATIKRQRSHWQHLSEVRFDTISTRMLYEIIFPRVVTYSKAYQTITKLSALDDGSEGFATFKVPTDAHNPDMIIQPAFVDTLLHAAGFIANSHVPANEVCICAKVESLRVLFDQVSPGQFLSVYCSLLDCVEGEVLADAFAVDSSGKVIASVEGMHFKKLQLRSFQAHLSRTIGGSKVSVSPAVPGKMAPQSRAVVQSTKPSQTATSSKNIQNSADSVTQILATVCELKSSDISADSTLDTLGFDSLTLIEFSEAVNKAFPGIDFGHASVQVDWSVKQLQDAIKSKLPSAASVHFETASSEVSSFDSEGSDSGSSSASSVFEADTSPSGPLRSMTPPTPASSIEDSFVRIRKIMEEVCGFPPSYLKPETTLESLGVDSLLSIELREALSEQLAMDVSESVFFGDMTIEGLSATVAPASSGKLSHQQAIPEDTPTTQKKMQPPTVVQSHPGTVPLFLFHDGSGTIGMYSSIKSLRRDVLGISNNRISEEKHWAQNLTDMASTYAAVIAETSYSEVIVGGWSFGGVLAHEVARHLTQMGKRVKGVILIDSPCPKDHQALPDLLIDHVLQGFTNTSSKSQKASSSWIANQFRTHACFLAGYQFKPVPATCRYVMLLSEEVMDISRSCGVEYPWLENKDAHERTPRDWEELLGQEVMTLKVSGNHFEPFTPANIETVSTQLKKACDLLADA